MRPTAVSEKQFQAQVLQLARLSGWRCYHVFDSRRSQAGFPDLCLVRPPVVLFAELKSDTGRLRPEQEAWLEALRGCESGVKTHYNVAKQQQKEELFMKSKTITHGLGLMAAVLVACAALLLAVSSSQAASIPTLQFNCNYLKTEAIDPILDPAAPHLHDFYGNTGVAADSTHETLVANQAVPVTTCLIGANTSSYWQPVFRDNGNEQTPLAITNYIRDTGDRSPNMQPFPEGLQNVASPYNGNVKYRCGTGSATSTPPVGCTQDWRVMFQFPNCWNSNAGLGQDSVLFNAGGCPSTHPYEFPEHQMAVKFPRPADGSVDAPVEVSAGAGEWHPAQEFAHADRFDADQSPEFNDKWLGPCVLDVLATQSSPSYCTNVKD